MLMDMLDAILLFKNGVTGQHPVSRKPFLDVFHDRIYFRWLEMLDRGIPDNVLENTFWNFIANVGQNKLDIRHLIFPRAARMAVGSKSQAIISFDFCE